MRRQRSEFLVAVFLLMGGATVWASGIGFTFDLPVMPFQYTVGAGPNGKVGTITISHGQASNLIAQQLDLGSDGAIGGGGGAADVVVDLAKVATSTNFDSSFQGDVYKLGANNYQIKGTLRISDPYSTLGTAPVQAEFVTTMVGVGGGYFTFDADLSPLSGNDSILQPGPGGSWSFWGIAGDTPISPDLDGVRGQMSLVSDRGAFDQGTCSGGYFTSPGMTLDTFFGSNRSSVSFDVKTIVTPEPSSVMGMVFVGALALSRRRLRLRAV